MPASSLAPVAAAPTNSSAKPLWMSDSVAPACGAAATLRSGAALPGFATGPCTCLDAQTAADDYGIAVATGHACEAPWSCVTCAVRGVDGGPAALWTSGSAGRCPSVGAYSRFPYDSDTTTPTKCDELCSPGPVPIFAFLQEAGLPHYASVLLAAGIQDVDALAFLDKRDLQDLGILRGHAIRLRKKLREYHEASLAMPEQCGSDVEHSWNQVEKLGSCRVAELLTQHLFDLSPGAKSLFPLEVRARYQEWTTGESGAEFDISRSVALRNIFAKLVNLVGCAAAGLRETAACVPTLLALGARHHSYGVHEKHFDMIGQALDLALRDVLGAGYTPKVRHAWQAAFGEIANAVVAGLRAAADSLLAAEGQWTHDAPAGAADATCDGDEEDLRGVSEAQSTWSGSEGVRSEDEAEQDAATLPELEAAAPMAPEAATLAFVALAPRKAG